MPPLPDIDLDDLPQGRRNSPVGKWIGVVIPRWAITVLARSGVATPNGTLVDRQGARIHLTGGDAPFDGMAFLEVVLDLKAHYFVKLSQQIRSGISPADRPSSFDVCG